MFKNKQKVLVAMSGGVDSSVAAALLLEDGYDVTGVFMRQWSDSEDTAAGVCSWKQDRRDALRVAAHLGIPMLTLNFEEEYKKLVMDYMFAEYEKGRTPNPDILCNKFIKFGVWLKKAKELGFDKLATGHYALLKMDNSVHLLEAKDTEKDQTYFLHQLTQEQLKDVLFPIGDLLKSEVRELARKYNLPTAERAESMGICFVGEVPMKQFLSQKIKQTKGKIVTSSGQEVGEHDGLAFYTVGQRHGLSLKSKVISLKSLDSQSLYVVGKNLERNELIVGSENDSMLYKTEAEVAEVNWVSGQMPVFPLKCEVRLRHRQEKQIAQIEQIDNQILIKFEKPQKAVTPGQFAVFYLNKECFGGGVIA